MVIVVTPELNEKLTVLEIAYVVEDTKEITAFWRFYKEKFTSEEGKRMLYIFIACAVLLLCVIICCICTCSYFCCCKPKVYDDPAIPGRRFSRRPSARRADGFVARVRTSMRLESFVHVTE